MRWIILTDLTTLNRLAPAMCGPWTRYVQRLTWLYGETEALARLNAGRRG